MIHIVLWCCSVLHMFRNVPSAALAKKSSYPAFEAKQEIHPISL